MKPGDEAETKCMECPSTLNAAECSVAVEGDKITIIAKSCLNGEDPVDNVCSSKCPEGEVANPNDNHECEACADGCGECYYQKFRDQWKQYCKECKQDYELSAYKECRSKRGCRCIPFRDVPGQRVLRDPGRKADLQGLLGRLSQVL